MSAEHHGRDDPSVHGGSGVRQAIAAQEAHADSALQQTRRHLSARRRADSHVPSRRHAQESHHRGARARPAHQAQGIICVLSPTIQLP